MRTTMQDNLIQPLPAGSAAEFEQALERYHTVMRKWDELSLQTMLTLIQDTSEAESKAGTSRYATVLATFGEQLMVRSGAYLLQTQQRVQQIALDGLFPPPSKRVLTDNLAGYISGKPLAQITPLSASFASAEPALDGAT